MAMLSSMIVTLAVIQSLILALLNLPHYGTGSPLSNPLLRDEDIDKVIPSYLDSKQRDSGDPAFYLSTPIKIEHVAQISLSKNGTVIVDEGMQQCPSEFKVRWITDVESSVYSTPVIFPAPQSGDKLIFVNTYLQALELINHDGFKPLGWPITFEASSFQGSPLLYDIDGDGNNDIGLVDKNANMYWIRVGEVAQYLEDYHIQVPKLKIKKDWYVGLDPNVMDNYVQISMFDHKNHNMGIGSVDFEGKPDAKGSLFRGKSSVLPPSATASPGVKRGSIKIDELSSLKSPAAVKQDTYPELHHDGDGIESSVDDRSAGYGEDGTESRRRLQEDPAADTGNGSGEKVSEDASSVKADTTSDTVAGDKDKELEGEGIPDVYPDLDKVPDFGEFNGYAADDYVNRHSTYGGFEEQAAEEQLDLEHYRVGQPDYKSFDDGFRGYYQGGMMNDSTFVYVDPHVLSSPVLSDVDGDGNIEVIMAVSYYFDAAEYAGKDVDFNTSMYIAGGIACWDLKSQDWSWLVHLDLTTSYSHFKALIYASPTVADLDGDGRMEVVIGTSMGLLYLLDGETGFVRRYFPLQFHEIQAQVAIADVRGGSELEIIVGDMAGNLVVVNTEAEIVWSQKLSGALPFTPTIGDINGDGSLDIVVVAISENAGKFGYEHHIWVLSGDDGEPLKDYPRALPKGAQISSSILLVDLHQSSGGLVNGHRVSQSSFSDPNLPSWLANSRGHKPAAAPSLQPKETVAAQKEFNKKDKHHGLHLIVPSHDGHLYIIEGNGRCAERIDIGQHIYSTPLVDDITNDGFLDILVGTMGGQVILIETAVPYHPMNVWSSFPKHRGNVFTHGSIGISIPLVEKKHLMYSSEITSFENITVAFDIWDTRRPSNSSKYIVEITRGTNKVYPLYRQEFTKPGRYFANVALAPPERVTLVVSLKTEHGLYFEDSFTISCGTKFYMWIKYLVLIPLALVILPLLLMKNKNKNKK